MSEPKECARCHKPILEGEEMVERINGRYVYTHRDCGRKWEYDQIRQKEFPKAKRTRHRKR